MKGTSIAGRKRFTEADLYETPTWATEALMNWEQFFGDVLEPACGYGAISDVVTRTHRVISSDKFDYGYGMVRDFLKDYPPEAPNIITNPPYNIASEFVQVAKMLATEKIAMFLKLSFLEGMGRYKMFIDTQFPLARVYVFSARVNPFPHGTEPPKSSGTIAFAWFVWDRSHHGSPTIKWINDNPKLGGSDGTP